jgi:hypothetical protein
MHAMIFLTKKRQQKNTKKQTHLQKNLCNIRLYICWRLDRTKKNRKFKMTDVFKMTEGLFLFSKSFSLPPMQANLFHFKGILREKKNQPSKKIQNGSFIQNGRK